MKQEDTKDITNKEDKFNADLFDIGDDKLNNLSNELITTIYIEGKDRLNVLTTIKESLRTRALASLAFIVTMLIALIGIVFQGGMCLFLFIPVCIAILMLLASSGFCLAIINTTKSKFTGTNPQQFFSERFINDFLHDDVKNAQEKHIKHKLCEDYADRIYDAVEENNKIGSYYKIAVSILYATPWVAILLFFFLITLL